MKTKLPIKTSEPKIIGYVVRYAEGTYPNLPSEALEFGPNSEFPKEKVKALWLGDTGTVFAQRTSAVKAIRSSVRYQQKHNLRWNEMYGPYLIDPVVVA